MPDLRQRAFLEVLEPVYDRLSRYALAVTRNEMDAEDLVSAAVLVAYEKFDPTANHERYLHYLIKIASRLHKRGRYRERKRVPYDASLAEDISSSGQAPETAAEIRLVMDALNTLPDKMRETVVLFDISDLSLEEIRQIQGGTLSGVKSRLTRGRERLAHALGVEPPKLTSQLVAKNPGPDMPILFRAEKRYV